MNSIVKDLFFMVSSKLLKSSVKLKLKPHEANMLKIVFSIALSRNLSVYENNLISKIMHQIDQFYI